MISYLELILQPEQASNNKIIYPSASASSSNNTISSHDDSSFNSISDKSSRSVISCATVEAVGSRRETDNKSTRRDHCDDPLHEKPGTVSTNEPNNTKHPLQSPTPNTPSMRGLVGKSDYFKSCIQDTAMPQQYPL
jgi:hypothetical protein